MEDLLKNLTVYKMVRPSKTGYYVYLILFPVLAIPALIAGICILRSGNESGIILLFLGIVLLAMLPVFLHREKQAKRLKEIRFAQFSTEDFFRLEDELQDAPFLYESFYLLKDYILIPQQEVLLHYDEILDIQVRVHKKNMITQGVTMYFICQDMPFEVMLVKWKSYLKYPSAFERQINERRSPSRRLNLSQKTEHSVRLPNIPS